MRVSAIFTVFTLLLISSVFANKVGDEQGVCKDIFVDHEIKDAFECINAHQSTLTNLTKPDDEGMLKLIDATNNEDVDIDSTFYLYCCFYSRPYCPSISWYKDGVKIQEQLNIRILEGGRTLEIYATPHVGGNYTCVATTPFGERSSFLIVVLKPRRVCKGHSSVVREPSADVIKVKKGSRQKLMLSYVCFGELPVVSVACRVKGKIVRSDSYYNTSLVRSGEENGPRLVYTIVIFNFSRSENITCRLNDPASPPPTTFVLVEKECEDSPYIVPKKGGGIALKYGANYTMKCSIYCLKRKNFNDPVWRDGRDKVIKTSNYSNYRLRERDLTRGGYAPASEPSYETSLTVINFTRSENFSCYVSEDYRTGTMFSLVLTSEDTELGQRSTVEESFFNRKGIWIVLGSIIIVCLVVVVVLFIRFREKLARSARILYRPNRTDAAARYDAFISYSEADGGLFVRSTLKPMLENECGYTLSLHYREFVPGTAIIDNIIDAIYDSRRILTVVTPKFLESEWCKFEVDQGLRRAIEKPNTLVVIMLNEIPKDQLPKTLRSFVSDVTFLLWNESKKDEMRGKLKKALGLPNTINNPDDCTSESSEVRGNGEDLDQSSQIGSHNTAINDIV